MLTKYTNRELIFWLRTREDQLAEKAIAEAESLRQSLAHLGEYEMPAGLYVLGEPSFTWIGSDFEDMRNAQIMAAYEQHRFAGSFAMVKCELPTAQQFAICKLPAKKGWYPANCGRLNFYIQTVTGYICLYPICDTPRPEQPIAENAEARVAEDNVNGFPRLAFNEPFHIAAAHSELNKHKYVQFGNIRVDVSAEPSEHSPYAEEVGI